MNALFGTHHRRAVLVELRFEVEFLSELFTSDGRVQPGADRENAIALSAYLDRHGVHLVTAGAFFLPLIGLHPSCCTRTRAHSVFVVRTRKPNWVEKRKQTELFSCCVFISGEAGKSVLDGIGDVPGRQDEPNVHGNTVCCHGCSIRSRRKGSPQ